MSCPPPYRPFRGAQPPHFVDRAGADDIGATGLVAASLDAYAAGPGDPRFHRLVVAAPALGKTALARAIGAEVARRLGWVVTFHRCQPKEHALAAVAAETLAGCQRLWPLQMAAPGPGGPGPGTPGPGVLGPGAPAPETEAAPWPRLRPGHPAGRGLVPFERLRGLLPPQRPWSWTDLKEFFTAAGSFAYGFSRGLLVVLDDADVLGAGELECAGHLARSLARDRLPVALLLTGGKEIGDHFSRWGHFSGSVWPTVLGRFDDSEAREALVVPAADRGTEFEDRALALLCAAAAGLPLPLQRLGFAAWSARPGQAGAVTIAAAEEALGLLAPETAAWAS